LHLLSCFVFYAKIKFKIPRTIGTYEFYKAGTFVKTISEENLTAKDKIQDAALRLFTESGYTRTTTAAIAKEAGVNEATIFRIFGTKTALFHDIYYRLTPDSGQISLSELTFGEDLSKDLTYLFRGYMILHILHMPAYRMSLQFQDEVYDRALYFRSFRKIEDMISQLGSYFNLLKYSGKIIDLDYAALSEFLFSLFLVKAPEFLLEGERTTNYDASAVDLFAEDYAAYIANIIKK